MQAIVFTLALVLYPFRGRYGYDCSCSRFERQGLGPSSLRGGTIHPIVLRRYRGHHISADLCISSHPLPSFPPAEEHGHPGLFIYRRIRLVLATSPIDIRLAGTLALVQRVASP